MIPRDVDNEVTAKILSEFERDQITKPEPRQSMREMIESRAPRAVLISIPASPGKFRVVLHDESIPPRVKTCTCYGRTKDDVRRVVERGFFGSGYVIVDLFPVAVKR